LIDRRPRGNRSIGFAYTLETECATRAHISAGAAVAVTAKQIGANPWTAKRLAGRTVQARQHAHAPEILDALERPATLDTRQLLSRRSGMCRASQTQGRQERPAQDSTNAAQGLPTGHVRAEQPGDFIKTRFHVSSPEFTML